MRSQSSSSCYNSYQASEHVGYSSHFSCPDVCVPILDICQGMSWCTEDVEVCDENLKIPKTIPLRPKYIYYDLPIEVEKLSKTSHHYYIHNAAGKINDRQYDIFDRSDEKKIKADTENLLDLSKLEFCYDSVNNKGIHCNRCIPKSEFCSAN